MSMSAALCHVLDIQDQDFSPMVERVRRHYDLPHEVMQDLVQDLCMSLLTHPIKPLNPSQKARYVWVLLQRRARDFAGSKAWASRDGDVPDRGMLENDSIQHNVYQHLEIPEVRQWILDIWRMNLRPKEFDIISFWLSNPTLDTKEVALVFKLASPSFAHKVRRAAATVLQQHFSMGDVPKVLDPEMVRIALVNV